jgi:hypothetical protein
MPGLKYPIPHKPMLGKGSVFLDRFDPVTGLPTGAQHLGNCSLFEIEDKPDKAKLFSGLNSSVTLIASALKKREPTITIKGTDFSSVHMAIAAISAAKTTLATTATVFTAEVLISAAQSVNALGRYFRLLNMNVDNVGTPPALTNGSTPLVAGTDFIVADAQLGIIYIPLTSTMDVSGTKTVTATYHTLVGSFDQVAGSSIPFIQGHLYFDPDPVDGQKIACDIWRVNLFANGKVGLIVDDYGNWELEGDILDDTANHPNANFYQYTFF